MAISACTCLLATVPFQQAMAEPSSRVALVRLAGQALKWGPPVPGRGASVTYAVLEEDRSYPTARNCKEMSALGPLLDRHNIDRADAGDDISAAFSLWAMAADVSFRQVHDPDQAQIVIGAMSRPGGIAFTDISRVDAQLRSSAAGAMGTIAQVRICLSPDKTWTSVADGASSTYDLRYVLVHEIGHAIGLDHPGRDDGIMGYAYQTRFENRLELEWQDRNGAAYLYGPARDQPESLSPGMLADGEPEAGSDGCRHDPTDCALAITDP